METGKVSEYMARKALEDLDITISKLPAKQEQIIDRWISTWDRYLKYENRFDPTMNRKYNVKDIVTVIFGYNVGSEQGGNRPAVVIDDNDKSNDTVMVVPLGSIDKANTRLGKGNVFLGEIPALNIKTRKPAGTETKALVNQMRAVSKLRIIAPKKDSDDVLQISEQQLSEIRNEIKDLFC